MAILFIDGQQHYPTSYLNGQKYSIADAGPSGSPGMQAGGGRFGGTSIRGFNSTTFRKTINPGDNTTIVGFAHRVNTAHVGGINFIEITCTGGPIQVVPVTNQGYVQVLRNGTSLGLTGIGLIQLGVYFHIGIKVVHHASAGSVIVQINGVEQLNLSGINTGSGNATQVLFRNEAGGTSTVDWCDVYIADGTGPAPQNTLLGDCRVETIRPTTEGAFSDWTPSTGTNNAANVDDTTPNDDTDYNTTTTAGATDTHVCSDIGMTAGSVMSVQQNLVARKDDTTIRQIAQVARHSGVNYDGPTVTLATTYSLSMQVRDLDPSGAAWTVGSVNAEEFGYKLVA